MEFETPAALLGRLKLGREEALQRLLTCLILHGPYPRWNSRNPLSPAGEAFLAALYERHFGPWPGASPFFVDEFEMLPEHDEERGRRERRIDAARGRVPDRGVRRVAIGLRLVARAARATRRTRRGPP